MNNNILLRQRISNLVNAINLTDDHVIEGICQFLNIKYPLEEPKMFERRLFGKTDDEILRALEFYDKHSEQAVQDDMTREEARKQVFNKVKNWEGSECHNFVLGLEALGLLKLKKEPEGTTDFICVSSVMKNDTLKTVYINHALINYIGDKLQEKCRAIFGTSWSNDIARVFARIAITEYELQKAKDNK